MQTTTSESAPKSLRELLDQWKSGDQDAATEIYGRFEKTVEQWAAWKMGPHLRAHVSPESIVLLVLNSALRWDAKKPIENTQVFLNILHKITHRKICDRANRLPDEPAPMPIELGNEPADDDFDLLLPRAGSAEVAEEVERIRRRMSPELFDVFERILAGHSKHDIAKQLDTSYATVLRRERKIFELLAQWSGNEKTE